MATANSHAGFSLHKDTQPRGSQRLGSCRALLTKPRTLAQCNIHPEEGVLFSNLQKGTL